MDVLCARPILSVLQKDKGLARETRNQQPFCFAFEATFP